MRPQLKVCGMKWNAEEVVRLYPDYLGFIFFENSPRNYTGPSIDVTKEIRKVGVFVNADIQIILNKVEEHGLSVIQLHGDETVDWVKELRNALNEKGYHQVTLWKVFSVGKDFNFNILNPYEAFVEAFLLDTKGRERGGTGRSFNWNLLKGYSSETPLVLSGGIGLDNLEALKEIIADESLPILAIDVNSKFETEPGRKDTSTLKTFMDELSCR